MSPAPDLYNAMRGKTCVVTGANSGIGKVTALALCRKGATVVAICRDRGRGEAAVEEIREKSGGGDISLLLADLSSQRQIRNVASLVLDKHKKVDVLVNNAGLIVDKR